MAKLVQLNILGAPFPFGYEEISPEENLFSNELTFAVLMQAELGLLLEADDAADAED